MEVIDFGFTELGEYIGTYNVSKKVGDHRKDVVGDTIQMRFKPKVVQGEDSNLINILNMTVVDSASVEPKLFQAIHVKEVVLHIPRTAIQVDSAELSNIRVYVVDYSKFLSGDCVCPVGFGGTFCIRSYTVELPDGSTSREPSKFADNRY